MDVQICNNSNLIPPKNQEVTLPILLTESQETTVKSCIKLFSEFNIITIKGDSGSGKSQIVREVSNRLDSIIEDFDICELAKGIDLELSIQHIVEYLESIVTTLTSRLLRNVPVKRSFDDIAREMANLNINGSRRKNYGIIYIRHYDKLTDLISNSKLLPLIITSFAHKLPANIRIIITTQNCSLPEQIHCCLELHTTTQDIEVFLLRYVHTRLISAFEYEYILKHSDNFTIGHILFCLKYAISMTKDTTSQNVSDIFIELYSEASNRLSGNFVSNRNQNILRLEDDLIGLDEIIDELTTSVITPLTISIPGIDMKKGLILCGPHGTGKTSIGRWLSHKLNERFHLIDCEVGRENAMIDNLESTINNAHIKGPAVVFIDNGDYLLQQPDTYHGLLRLIDSIKNKQYRVCIILTCINIQKVPTSLLISGRLEMSLMTKLPDRRKIQIILIRAMNRICQIINDYDINLAASVSKYIDTTFTDNIATKMIGWNYSDIHRCVDDISRLIISDKGTNLLTLFEKSIRQIRGQYDITENNNVDNLRTDTYIV